MKKKWFTLILAIMILVYCFNAMPLLAAEKQDAKAVSNSETKTTVSPTENNQNALCRKVSKLVKNKNIDKYAANSKSIPDRPRYSEYIDLDIDFDGKIDKVEVSSGSEGSYLDVKLSSGDKYDLEENGFIMIVRFDKQVYALVTYWEWKRRPDDSLKGKEVGHRLYLLTKQKAKMICDK